MPVINLVVHPKHDPFMPMSWETWELLISGLRNVQYIALKKLTPELRNRMEGPGVDREGEEPRKVYRKHRKTSHKITAIYYIDGAGPGNFPPISAVLPFINEIKSWGFDLVHMSCPALDQFSYCVFRKN